MLNSFHEPFSALITSPDTGLAVYSCPVSKVTNDTMCIRLITQHWFNNNFPSDCPYGP